ASFWGGTEHYPAFTYSGMALECLTTPIAYLGVQLPADPFANTRGLTFVYINMEELDIAAGTKGWMMGSSNPRFLLLSYGPDTDQAGRDPVTLPLTIYDPTNG